MQFNIDELSILLSTFAVVYGIPRAMGRHGGFRKCIRAFLENGSPAEPMILFFLIIPEITLALYYAGIMLVPEFRGDAALRAGVIRPSIFTSNVILAIYFLNGRLVRWLRAGARYCISTAEHIGKFTLALPSFIVFAWQFVKQDRHAWQVAGGWIRHLWNRLVRFRI